MKPIMFTKEEYHEALSIAIDVTTNTMDREKSHGEESICKILAWVWDSTLINATLDDFLPLDFKSQDIAVKLLIGRLNYGRPVDHEKCEEVEKHYYSSIT